eukprot:PLAT7555.2.p1 GENE.PLAT7555.2~~PLAT7555.2.p1  ORF type:complete len:732 (-),score=333.90 PLAT7555.2:102-2069(-)
MKQLNVERRRRRDAALEYGIVSSLLEVAENHGGTEVVQCWRLLRHVTGEKDVVAGEFTGASVLAEGQFAADYAAAKPELMLQMAAGARRALEEQYLTYIQRRVDSSRARASLGGVPGVTTTVRAFLNMKLHREAGWPSYFRDGPMYKDFPLWPQIYYCMRCGQMEEAALLAESYSRPGGGSVEPELLNALRAAAGGEAPRAVMHALRSLYERLQSTVDREVDPFKLAIANLLSCAEYDDVMHPDVGPTIQDFMWQKLLFATSSSEHTVADLAVRINEYGHEHFDRDARNPNPFIYFQVLLLSLQFERAVNYLAVQGPLVEATHFAVALHHYGLLRTPEDLLPPDVGPPGFLLAADSELPQLDISKLLQQYVYGFAMTNPPAAIDYFLVLPQEVAALRDDLIRSVILETRQYDLLLGRLMPDGSRERGELDRHFSREEVELLAESAGSAAEEMSQMWDAMALFVRAGRLERCVSILNVQLSRVLVPPNAEREEWLHYARDFRTRFIPSGPSSWLDHESGTTLELLMNLMDFFSKLEQKRWEEAREQLDYLGLLPSEEDDVEPAKERFETVSDLVKRNLPHIMLGAMSCLFNMYNSHAHGPKLSSLYRSPARSRSGEVKMQQLRMKAQALITFASLISFRLPPETLSRLTRMESMMS